MIGLLPPLKRIVLSPADFLLAPKIHLPSSRLIALEGLHDGALVGLLI
jgi:hypothetical protein